METHQTFVFSICSAPGRELLARQCVFTNTSHNALHAPDHAAGHVADHAVQTHVLKNPYQDLGMPKPCIQNLNAFCIISYYQLCVIIYQKE